MDTVRSSAHALLAVINDILDFSKIEAGQLTIETYDFDLQGIVEAVRTLLLPDAQAKGVSLTADYIGLPEHGSRRQAMPGASGRLSTTWRATR